MTPLDKLIQTFGAMTELWMIAYKGFLGQGLTPEDAMKHTKEFMEVTIKSMMEFKGEK